MNEPKPAQEEEIYQRTCPYCGQMVPIDRFVRLSQPEGMAAPATDCPTCGYARLPKRLWPEEWK